jgi:hypothetical protein
MEYFNYQVVAAEAKISADKLEELVALFRSEYPNDPMMVELHVLRACRAIRDGRLTLDEALATTPVVTAA